MMAGIAILPDVRQCRALRAVVPTPSVKAALPPEIVEGFMSEQIEATIASRYPLAWEFIRVRNIFGGPLPSHVVLGREKRRRERLMSVMRRGLFDYFGRK